MSSQCHAPNTPTFQTNENVRGTSGPFFLAALFTPRVNFISSISSSRRHVLNMESVTRARGEEGSVRLNRAELLRTVRSCQKHTAHRNTKLTARETVILARIIAQGDRDGCASPASVRSRSRSGRVSLPELSGMPSGLVFSRDAIN